jgi:diamine N-acetyltransferase
MIYGKKMKIIGENIVLVPAKESDREKLFAWLTQSDLTSSMFGKPNYPDYPIPTWEEFCRDYTLDFFSGCGDGKGRCYIILHNDVEIGTVGYDLLDKVKDRVVLDIWMKSEKYCCKGYGSQSLDTMCNYLHETYNITNFVISPSINNKRAIAAYMKAGFETIKALPPKEQEKEFGISEYSLNALMVKSL